MNKRKATIYDFVRMCNNCKTCSNCPLGFLKKEDYDCRGAIVNNLDEANKIILKWCNEHPNETRQSEFLKQYPNTKLINGIISICPAEIMGEDYCTCDRCTKEYWLEERE